jgi:hypothetical protein
MERKHLYQDRRGVSTIVSYVLIIIIALALSVGVYSFLKLQIPKFQTPECTSEVPISITEFTCDSSSNLLSVTIKNQGLFSVDAVYVRLGDQGRTVLTSVSPQPDYLNPSLELPGLLPGQTITLGPYPTGSVTSAPGNYELEVQPAVFEDNELALCPQYTVSQTIQCS